MRKEQKKRIWTKEQKLEIIHKHINEHISAGSLSKEYNADKSMICHWIRDYDCTNSAGRTFVVKIPNEGFRTDSK